MNTLAGAIDQVLAAQAASEKPLGIILAGHNGSGKSTMWRRHLSAKLQIPLVNADRMMLSILPELDSRGFLPGWAAHLRDNDLSWMRVAQKGVEAFVAQAMVHRVPFAMETVFSHWQPLDGGGYDSKIKLIEQLQEAGYFVLLLFVGLSSANLSIARVSSRVEAGGHAVDEEKLESRFPRTQTAIRHAAAIADATIMSDNSLDEKSAFSVCRVQLKEAEVYDIRRNQKPPAAITEWLDVVSPLPAD